MELEFKNERITIIKRLKGLSISDIDNKMKELSGRVNTFGIDRWEKIPGKRHFETVKLFARAIDMPIGFFYYNNVQIEMKNLKVEILIVDTGEKIEFNLLTPSTAEDKKQ